MADVVTEALAGMKSMGREPMGNTAFAAVSSPSATTGGTLVPDKNTSAGDPAMTGRPARPQIMQEKLGASYRVRPGVGRTVTDPSAAATMHNARTIPSSVNRSGQNFYMAVADPN